jgi:hypothetical protein
MPKIRTAAPQVAATIDRDEDEDIGRTRASERRAPMRDTRETEMRMERADEEAADSFGDQVWRRPTSLDAPPPRPGMVQRWVRMTQREGKDQINWSGKFREGWRPRDPATIPQQFHHLTGVEQGAGSLIAVGGMVLCEMPEKVLAQKRGYIRELNRRQELSVSAETDKISREGVAAGAAPITRQDEVTVSRGPGRRPSTALAE